MPPLSKQISKVQEKRKAGPASARGRPKNREDDSHNTNIKENLGLKASTYEDLKQLDRDQLLSSLNQLLLSVENSDRNKEILENLKDVSSKNMLDTNKKMYDLYHPDDTKSKAGPASKKHQKEVELLDRRPGPASKTDCLTSQTTTTFINPHNPNGKFEVYRDQYETRRKKRPPMPRNRNPVNSQDNDNEKFEPQYFRVFSDNPVYRTSTRMCDIDPDNSDVVETSDDSNNEKVTPKKQNKECSTTTKANKTVGRKKGSGRKKNDNDALVDLTMTDTETDLKVGDKVLAMWKLNQKYPAKIIDIEPNEAYLVEFYDGVLWKAKPSRVWKMSNDEEEKYKEEMEDMGDNDSSDDSAIIIEDSSTPQSNSSRKRKAKTNDNNFIGKGPKHDLSSDENDDKDGSTGQSRTNHTFHSKPGPASSKKLKPAISQSIDFSDPSEIYEFNDIYDGIKTRHKGSKLSIGPKSRINRSWNPVSDALINCAEENFEIENTLSKQYQYKVWTDWVFSSIWNYNQRHVSPPFQASSDQSVENKLEGEVVAIDSSSSTETTSDKSEPIDEKQDFASNERLCSQPENNDNEDLNEWKELVFNDIWKKNIVEKNSNEHSIESILDTDMKGQEKAKCSDENSDYFKREDTKFDDNGSETQKVKEMEQVIDKHHNDINEIKTFIFEEMWSSSKSQRLENAQDY